MIRALLVLLLLVGITPRAHAQDATSDVTVYRVKQGDTLDLIAAEFYGDRNKAIFIMVSNKILHPRPLKAGEKIRIPVTRQVTTSPGDTWESIAATYLGDGRRSAFLAEFNGMTTDDLASGTPLQIPFTITHTSAGTEAVSDIAKAYFGDSKNASMIRRYNFLEARDGIEKDEKIIVPINNVRLSASKMPAMDAEAKARRDRQRESQARAARVLPVARQAWHQGEFAAVKAALSEVELDVDYLDTAQAIEVGLLLGAMHVAHGDSKPALEAFKRVLERRSTYQMSQYHFPPKIQAVWKEAGGTIAESQ
ncbi:MAG: LysM peptidoglycan-binding domain-containing protein [Deltaproteobacteria bacterium]|nr:LysM peptidoglycan-binding domain-containing protein [Deltaproteobacteria bacterium]